MRLVVGPILAAGNLVVASIVVLAVAGIYMAVTVWADERPAWILVATVSFLLLAPFGIFVIDRRVRAIAKQARSMSDMPDGLLSPALAAATPDPVLVAGLRIYIAVLLGIVFLMTTKPHLTAAMRAMGSALALGAAACVPLWKDLRHGPTDAPLTTAEM